MWSSDGRSAARGAQAARRSCSSSGTSGSPKVSTALGRSRRRCRRLEHLQQVARERDVAGQPLGDERVQPHQRHRHVDARPPAAARPLQPRPRTRSRSPRPGRRARTSGSSPPRGRPPWRSTRATSSAQIGWMRCLPLPMIGVTGASLRELHERRQDPAVRAEDEARPEDHVRDARRPPRPAPSPTSRRSRGRGPSSPRSSRARS